MEKYSFEGGLSHPFKAVKLSQYMILYPLAYAFLATLLVGLFLYLMRGEFSTFMEMVEALDAADTGEDDPGEVLTALFAAMRGFLPWIIAATLVSWVFSAVFTSATMRRYIRDEGFSLRFGMDEVRMMGVILCWSIFYMILFGLPLLLIFFGIFEGLAELIEAGDTLTPAEEEAAAAQMVGGMLGGFALMFLIAFPLYVFFATRLAPCFGLTIAKRKFVFFDAWNVSKGRFWPILGGYLIIAVAGGMVVGILEQIFQFMFMIPLAGAVERVEASGDFGAAFLSPAVLISVGLYLFITLALRSLLAHASHGPAAFAARHDPRGGVLTENMLANFE